MDSTKESLVSINTTIMDAHGAGLSKTEYKLPLNFRRINNVSNKEIQTEVYFNIVSELERLGYDIRLRFCKEYTIIVIGWIVKADDSELDIMKEKLLSLQ